jgi:release factor glutamine methyltransferase
VTTIAATLQSAVRRLENHSESPRLDAELLLGKVMGLPRSALIARGNESVAPGCVIVYGELIALREGGTPIAYLTGSSEFWSLPLTVTAAVLVPRPETETLVEHALQLKPRDATCSVLDLGTGSGAIALSVASERPHWRITGVDVSAQALEIAARNAQALGFAHVRWLESRWFDAVSGERFDLILANPPYIAASDPALAKLTAEPKLALVAGPTGLEALSAIIAEAPRHLYDGGWLLMEHGNTQAADVAGLLKQHGFDSIRTISDSAGWARITLGLGNTQQREHP